MYAQVEKQKENKSRAVANSVVQKNNLIKDNRINTPLMVDLREGSIVREVFFNGKVERLNYPKVAQLSKYKKENEVLLDGGTKVTIVEVKVDGGENEANTVYTVRNKDGFQGDVNGDEIKEKENVNLLAWNKFMTDDEVVENLISFSKKIKSDNNLREPNNPGPYGIKSSDYKAEFKKVVSRALKEENENEDDEIDPLVSAMGIAGKQLFLDGNHRMVLALMYLGLQKRNTSVSKLPVELFYALYKDREEGSSDHTTAYENLENILLEETQGKGDISTLEQNLVTMTGSDIEEYFNQKKLEDKNDEEEKWKEIIEKHRNGSTSEDVRIYKKQDFNEIIEEYKLTIKNTENYKDEFVIVYLNNENSDAVTELENGLYPEFKLNQ